MYALNKKKHFHKRRLLMFSASRTMNTIARYSQQKYSISADFPSSGWHGNVAVCECSCLTYLQVLHFVIGPGFLLCVVETATGSCCAREAPDLTVLSETHLPLPLPPKPQSWVCERIHTAKRNSNRSQCFPAWKLGLKKAIWGPWGKGGVQCPSGQTAPKDPFSSTSLGWHYGLISGHDFKLKLRLMVYIKQRFLNI